MNGSDPMGTRWHYDRNGENPYWRDDGDGPNPNRRPYDQISLDRANAAIPLYDIMEMGDAAYKRDAMVRANNKYYASKGIIDPLPSSADDVVSASINATVEGTKEGVVATARGTAAYYTGGLSEAAITTYDVSQAKTVTEVQNILQNNAKNQVFLVVATGSANASRTGSFLGKEAEIAPHGIVDMGNLGVANPEAHSSAQYEAYKLSLTKQEIANPGSPLSGPVVVDNFNAPKTTTPAQAAQLREYAALSNLAEREGSLNPAGRVSTKGAIEAEAAGSRRRERVRAASEGEPYNSNVAMHAPDSGRVGKGEPPFWQSGEKRVNSTLAGQQRRYPLGFKPSRFIYIGDLDEDQ